MRSKAVGTTALRTNHRVQYPRGATAYPKTYPVSKSLYTSTRSCWVLLISSLRLYDDEISRWPAHRVCSRASDVRVGPDASAVAVWYEIGLFWSTQRTSARSEGWQIKLDDIAHLVDEERVAAQLEGLGAMRASAKACQMRLTPLWFRAQVLPANG